MTEEKHDNYTAPNCPECGRKMSWSYIPNGDEWALIALCMNDHEPIKKGPLSDGEAPPKA